MACGSVPPSLHEAMRVPYMRGDFSFPLQYGYSLVGEVHSEGHPLHGQLVHVMHPHAEMAIVRESDVFPVPEGIPAARATLAANVETALTALWDANVNMGDRVLVTGFGMIGSLVARLLSMIRAVEVDVQEIHPDRCSAAQEMGFQVISCEAKEGHYDIAFHTSGTSAGLQASLDAVGKEGTVVELSWYGTKAVKVLLGSAFHVQRKRLISSQVSNIPANKSARWDYRRRKEVVFDLLKDPAFDRHITENINFADCPAFFESLRKQLPAGIGYAIQYDYSLNHQPE